MKKIFNVSVITVFVFCLVAQGVWADEDDFDPPTLTSAEQASFYLQGIEPPSSAELQKMMMADALFEYDDRWDEFEKPWNFAWSGGANTFLEPNRLSMTLTDWGVWEPAQWYYDSTEDILGWGEYNDDVSVPGAIKPDAAHVVEGDPNVAVFYYPGGENKRPVPVKSHATYTHPNPSLSNEFYRPLRAGVSRYDDYGFDTVNYVPMMPNSTLLLIHVDMVGRMTAEECAPTRFEGKDSLKWYDMKVDTGDGHRLYNYALLDYSRGNSYSPLDLNRIPGDDFSPYDSITYGCSSSGWLYFSIPYPVSEVDTSQMRLLARSVYKLSEVRYSVWYLQSAAINE